LIFNFFVYPPKVRSNVEREKQYFHFEKDNPYSLSRGFVAYGTGGKSIFCDRITNIHQRDKENCKKITWKVIKPRLLDHKGKNYLTFPTTSV
jgi:hypothetical protein